MNSETNQFYVNSFPRSGNTWVRRVLNSILDPVNLDVNPKFRKLFRVIPYTKFPQVDNVTLNDSELRMIKSHGSYETCGQDIPIVYLVRDGRDAIISYYHFNVDHRGYSEGFDSYFDRHVLQDRMVSKRERVLRKFMGDWSENVHSYADKKNVLIVRYEDLRAEPAACFEKMIQFTGVFATTEMIRNAVSESRRELDEKRARHERARGVCGGWRDVLSKSQSEQFTARHKAALTFYGYATD